MTEPAPGTEQLNLKVKSQDGEEVFFKIKASTQLKKLMDAYCQRQSVIFHLISAQYQQCQVPL
jgi:small ubiquitin-related modifier